MGCLTVALTITAAILVSGRPMVEDPSHPEGLNPIETLTDPTSYAYTEMKGRGYEVERKKVEGNNNLIDQDYRGELNVAIRRYLDFLESWRRKASKNERGAISTMKLLIVHSWIFFSMEPDLNLLKGATSIKVDDNTSLDSVRKEILLELDVRNALTPMADTILLYSTGAFQTITKELQANIKACRTAVVNPVDVYKISEEKLQAKVIKVNEIHEALMNKNKMLFRFHLIALKMILQSYIKLYDKQTLTGQTNILLKSSDGSKSGEFTIPPLKAEQFEQLMVEAEMEGELDPEDLANERPYTSDDYRKEQNSIIKKYMESFEKIRSEVLSSQEESEALNTVKLLVAQSWIHMLRPDLNLLKNVVSLDGEKTLEQVKEKIELQLKKTVTSEEVSDAIVFYEKTLSSKIRDQLQTQGQELVSKIDNSLDNIAGLPEGPVKAREVKIRDDTVRELEDLRLVIEFHEMSLRMSVQSYALDFLTKPYPQTVTFTSPRGHVTTLMPPLDPDSFEEMAFAGTENSPDEDF